MYTIASSADVFVSRTIRLKYNFYTGIEHLRDRNGKSSIITDPIEYLFKYLRIRISSTISNYNPEIINIIYKSNRFPTENI